MKKIRPILSKSSFDELENERVALQIKFNPNTVKRTTYEEYLAEMKTGKHDCYFG